MSNSSKWSLLAQVIVMSLAVLLADWVLPGVHIRGTVWSAILVAVVISLLNNFIRPILIVITLPFTVFSMGLFLFVINALLIEFAAVLVSDFSVDGFGSALLFSLLLTLFNYLLEIPNRKMRRPDYERSDGDKDDNRLHRIDHDRYDDDDFQECEEVD